MDTILHCNDLKCRATVTDRAVVTTCSHIFCLPCAERLDLTAPQDGQRKCPACHTFLLNLDDAVVAALNPTEDYKTSILSGLSPTVIMECAGRGLSFWAYQMAQEITYQEYLARSLADRYTSLQAYMEGQSKELNHENTKLKGKLEAIHAENANLVKSCHTLEQKYKEKQKTHQALLGMYQKLKAQITNPTLESAANHVADEVAQNAQRESQSQRPRDSGIRRVHSNNSESSGDRHQREYTQQTEYVSQPYQSQPLHDRSNLGTARSSQLPPASQRQHLPAPTFGHYNNSIRQGTGVASFQQGTSMRGSIAPRGFPGDSPGGAPGLTANARSGRPAMGQNLQIPGSRGGYAGVGRPTYGHAEHHR